MKWVNHKAVGFALGLVITGNIFVAAGSAALSTIPDMIEGPDELKVLKHRGNSHNIWFWLPTFILPPIATFFFAPLLATQAEPMKTVITPHILYLAATAWAIGIISHLLADAMTVSGVPVSLDGKRKLALKLFKTGEYREHLMAAAILFWALWLRGDSLFSALSFFR